MSQAPATRTQAGGDTQQLILQTALREFSEKGFDGATAREIANLAGVNHGLIRYYFGTKEKLWRAAVDLAFAELNAGLARVIADPDLSNERERTRQMIRNYVRFVARRPEFVRLMHEEGKRKGPRMRWMVDRHVKPIYEAMSELMSRAQGKGFLPTGIAPIHFHYILAGSVGLIFHQAEECKRLIGADPFDEAIVEEHARAVEYLFLGPPDQEKP
jgi:TetR/AcrR family transcriptional regulator